MNFVQPEIAVSINQTRLHNKKASYQWLAFIFQQFEIIIDHNNYFCPQSLKEQVAFTMMTIKDVDMSILTTEEMEREMKDWAFIVNRDDYLSCVHQQIRDNAYSLRHVLSPEISRELKESAKEMYYRPGKEGFLEARKSFKELANNKCSV